MKWSFFSQCMATSLAVNKKAGRIKLSLEVNRIDGEFKAECVPQGDSKSALIKSLLLTDSRPTGNLVTSFDQADHSSPSLHCCYFHIGTAVIVLHLSNSRVAMKMRRLMSRNTGKERQIGLLLSPLMHEPKQTDFPRPLAPTAWTIGGIRYHIEPTTIALHITISSYIIQTH
jgi:hypothetical protein